MTDATLLARIHALEMRVAELENKYCEPAPMYPTVKPRTWMTGGSCTCPLGTFCGDVGCPRRPQTKC